MGEKPWRQRKWPQQRQFGGRMPRVFKENKVSKKGKKRVSYGIREIIEDAEELYRTL